MKSKQPDAGDPLLFPDDPKKSKRTKDGLRPNPEEKANIFSRITFMYMIPFFYRGYRKPLEVDDMYQPLPEHDSEQATKRMDKAWTEEQQVASKASRPASLLRAIIREYWKEVARWGFLLLLEEAIKLSQPVFMGRLIRYFRFDSPLTEEQALFAAFGVAASAALTTTIHHPYFYGLQKTGMQLKIGASGLIVQKGVRLSSAALQKATVGHMVNILSTDINKFDMGFIFVHYIWIAPLILFSYGYLIWEEIGVSTLAGFGAIILLIPFQGYCSRQMGACRREIAVRADKRISVMNEILNGIRVIKMYAWEGAFSNVIGELRSYEVIKVRANAIFQSLVMGLFWASGKLIILFAAACFVALGNDLTAERIFVATALYNACRLPVTLFLPFSIQFICEMRVSIKRIQNFLELEDFQRIPEAKRAAAPKKKKENGKREEEIPLNGVEILPENVTRAETNISPYPAGDKAQIEMNSFSTSWTTSEEEGDDVVAIKNVSFTAKKGDLIAVVGPVGAGKSSLLYSLLGEARATSGKLSMSGTLAYCAQDSWIFSGTVKENVIFGHTFSEERYKNALEVSALLNDVSQFPQRDETMVGDRGTSLSGGQKARVALARAIYADADIYLLDDPLSAVDAAVGRFLFDKCICAYLKNKVTILVTHQVQFLDKANTVLLMKNGEVIAAGSLAELKRSHAEEFTSLIQETERTYSRLTSMSSARSRTTSASSEDSDMEIISIDRQQSTARSEKEPVVGEPKGKAEHVVAVQEEERADGAVAWRIYWVYIKAMCGHLWTVVPLMFFVLFVQGLSNLGDWWLNKWASASERALAMAREGQNYTGDTYTVFGQTYTLDLTDYEIIFASLTTLLVILAVARCVWFRLRQTVASILLHQRMFEAVVNTSIHFFDMNPIGRILNRFSKDVGTMDDQLSFVFFEFLMGALNIFGLVAVIVLLNPLIFLPTLPLMFFFVFLRVVYLRSSRDVKRLEATSRSPLYSHISATMQGLITVRAFSQQNNIIERYHHVQNVNSAAFGLSLSTARWFAVSIDWMVAVFVSFVAFFCVIGHNNRSSGEVALMLVYAVQLTGFFSWIMRQSAELQNGMVSVERIVNYAELPSEHLSGTNSNISDNWPSAGHIKMQNLYLKYDEDSNYVLRDVNLDIKPKEKIGIVGRTGAGKSSLLRALFRLTVPSTGAILIDDINTSTIPLKKLRKNIAIIPQEPVLFIGSLRRNLDPFDEYPDEALWDVLEQVELKQTVSEMPGGLDASMQEGGSNFSVGQRQLVCLARALLRKAKILVIDEATANVDQMTDALIQGTLRKRFADSTVLTIAHRLNTIMDSTRVLVLKDGQVAEFDAAHKLLQKKESILSSLVDETGPANAVLLKKMAKEAYETRSS